MLDCGKKDTRQTVKTNQFNIVNGTYHVKLTAHLLHESMLPSNTNPEVRTSLGIKVNPNTTSKKQNPSVRQPGCSI